MIDLHCHILPGVDDGSRSMEETVAILKKAEKEGFTQICFTPHYAEPNYVSTKSQNMEILREVKARMEEEKIEIELQLGNEIFIQQNMEQLLESGEIATLANTHYVLIELPMYQMLPQEIVKRMLDAVREKGFKIVIAHPERYRYFQIAPERILDYVGDDVIFQGNYASILGVYGRDTEKAIKKLLKINMIHYLSSDVHQIYRCFYDEIYSIKKKLLKVVDEEYIEFMTEVNPKLLLEDKEVMKYEDK